MRLHNLKHLLSETLVLGALVMPFAVALAVLIGLASWIWGGHEIGVRASWIALCATMSVAPIFLRVSCGPDTRVICDHCMALRKSRLYHRCGKSVQNEHRQHPRYRVAFRATFSNDRTSGFGMIEDLSTGGCRVRSKLAITPGEFGKVSINLPDCQAPLKVSRAAVRWSMGNECGMEFIRIDPDEQVLLHRVINQIGIAKIGEAEQTVG